MPALDVWKMEAGKVRHFWAGEAGETADPGQDAHGAPDPTPLWTILDLTPAGRGEDWYPKLDYGEKRHGLTPSRLPLPVSASVAATMARLPHVKAKPRRSIALVYRAGRNGAEYFFHWPK